MDPILFYEQDNSRKHFIKFILCRHLFTTIRHQNQFDLYFFRQVSFVYIYIGIRQCHRTNIAKLVITCAYHHHYCFETIKSFAPITQIVLSLWCAISLLFCQYFYVQTVLDWAYLFWCIWRSIKQAHIFVFFQDYAKSKDVTIYVQAWLQWQLFVAFEPICQACVATEWQIAPDQIESNTHTHIKSFTCDVSFCLLVRHLLFQWRTLRAKS